MSVRIMAAVWDHGPADQSELLVLLALADFADDAGVCWPSMVRVAEKARMSERNARYVIRRLEAAGYVEAQISRGRNASRYRIIAERSSSDAGAEPHKPGKSCRVTTGGTRQNTAGLQGDKPGNYVPGSGAPTRQNGASNPATAIAPEPSRTTIREERATTASLALPAAREKQQHAASLFDLVLDAADIGRTGRIPTYWMPPAAEMHVSRWVTDLGLTEAEVVAVVHQCRKRHHDPPNGPRAFDHAMQQMAAAKAAPALTATGATPHVTHATAAERRAAAQHQRLARRLAVADALDARDLGG